MPASYTVAPARNATDARRADRKDPIAPHAANVTPAAALQAFADDPNFMASLARGLAVIGAFTEQRGISRSPS